MNVFSLSNFLFRRRGSYFLLFAVLSLLFFSYQIFAQETDENETEDPVAVFNRGQEAHEKGDLTAAIKFYEQALKIVPEFPEAEFQKGNALLALGKSAEAEKAFRRAIELRPEWTPPMANLGSLLIRRNQLAEAELILTKAIQLNEQNFPAYAALTELRINARAKPEAIRELLEKIKTMTAKANPTASVWSARAALENYLGDRKSAKTSLQRALEIDPRNTSALSELTDIALVEGDTNRASELIKILAQIAPEMTNVKVFQARLLNDTGKATEAVKILDSVNAPSKEITALRDKIAANSSINADELEKSLEKESNNGVVLGRLCVLLRTQNPSKALEYCRRAVEAEPENFNHAVGFGAALVQTQNYQQAVNLFRKLMPYTPDNFTVHANLATALFQLKRFGEAKTEYQWLSEKQPDLAATYYFLGIIHDQTGEYMDAMANYQQFLRLATEAQNKLEIEKVKLRLPALEKQIKEKKGKKNE